MTRQNNKTRIAAARKSCRANETPMNTLFPLILLLLAGCADPQRSADAAFPQYQGKSIETLIMRWGGPASATPTETMTTYTWVRNDTVPLVLPTTSVSYIGTRQVTTTGTSITSYGRSCKIDVFVRDKVISTWQFRGADHLCAEMLDELRN
jgi:hypothetical protein